MTLAKVALVEGKRIKDPLGRLLRGMLEMAPDSLLVADADPSCRAAL